MGLFRRTPKTGRHALGAAVTSIPSGPPPSVALPSVALPLPVVEPAVEPVPQPVAPAEPSVMASIAELLASGEAWSTAPMEAAPPAPVAPVAAPAPAPVVAAPLPVAPVPASVVPVAPSLSVPQPLAPPAARDVSAPPVPPAPPSAVVPPPTVMPVPTMSPHLQNAPRPVQPAPPEPAAGTGYESSSARSSLQAALAELLPLQAQPVSIPAAPAPAAAPARVQLGFRDGTSTSLDPSSSQSQALQELAQTLTRRD